MTEVNVRFVVEPSSKLKAANEDGNPYIVAHHDGGRPDKASGERRLKLKMAKDR